jgi:hypothetical protein
MAQGRESAPWVNNRPTIWFSTPKGFHQQNSTRGDSRDSCNLAHYHNFMQRDPLPDDDQRRALGMLLHDAFNFMRYASEKESQELAYALHNIPAEIYGWGVWSVSATRGRLKKFQAENYTHPYHGPDFVAIFNEIFPPIADKSGD